MPADYNIPMSDAQITQALQLMVERVSEGWAQETFDGSPVGSGSPYYHKSSKWWATQAADAAARAEAAVPAGTAGAVFFDRAQTLTTAQQEQARQNIKAGGSNTNLFKNAWFSINQRELTSGTSGYAADMWNTTYGSGGMSWYRNPDGSITLYPAANSYAALVQKFEADFISFMTGKTVTLSALLGNGDIVSVTTIFQPITLDAGQNVQFSISPSIQTVQVRTITMNVGQTIRAAKLELGSVSTLANDAPPNPAEELAKCQYNGILKLNELHLVYGKALGTTAALFMIPWKHRAGDSGTSYVSGMISKIFHSGGAITVSSNPAKNKADTDFIRLTVTGLSGLTDNEPLIGEIGANGLIVSNDL